VKQANADYKAEINICFADFIDLSNEVGKSRRYEFIEMNP
jgi:hypothetical protein